MIAGDVRVGSETPLATPPVNMIPSSPRSILKSPASRSMRRAAQHAAMEAALMARATERIVFKVVVLGGAGTGKSALLRAAAGERLSAGALSMYVPTLAPHFSTIRVASFRGRPVYLQLWEIPFALCLADADARCNAQTQTTTGGSSAAAAAAFRGAKHLEVALAGAHAALVLFDARETHPPLRVIWNSSSSSSSSGSGSADTNAVGTQRREWCGTSLEAADIARGVLSAHTCSVLAAQGNSLPLYLLAHKGDHMAALAATLALAATMNTTTSNQHTSQTLSSTSSTTVVDNSSSGIPPRKMTGIVEDYYTTDGAGGGGGGSVSTAGTGTKGDGVVNPGANAHATATAAAFGDRWASASARVRADGFGVAYLRSARTGVALCNEDIARYCALAGYRSWTWTSTLGVLTDAPATPGALLATTAMGAGSNGSSSSSSNGGNKIDTPVAGAVALAAGLWSRFVGNGGGSGSSNSDGGGTSSLNTTILRSTSVAGDIPTTETLSATNGYKNNNIESGGGGIWQSISSSTSMTAATVNSSSSGSSSSRNNVGGVSGISEPELATRLSVLSRGSGRLAAPNASITALLSAVVDDCLECYGYLR